MTEESVKSQSECYLFSTLCLFFLLPPAHSGIRGKMHLDMTSKLYSPIHSHIRLDLDIHMLVMAKEGMYLSQTPRVARACRAHVSCIFKCNSNSNSHSNSIQFNSIRFDSIRFDSIVVLIDTDVVHIRLAPELVDPAKLDPLGLANAEDCQTVLARTLQNCIRNTYEKVIYQKEGSVNRSRRNLTRVVLYWTVVLAKSAVRLRLPCCRIV